jgi:hypothetical protein
MPSNLDRFRADLDALIAQGHRLDAAMKYEQLPDEVAKQAKKELGAKSADYLAKLPNPSREYQAWYSEAKAMLRQLLPDRLDDFVSHYDKPRPRREITFENYRIEDYLQGLRVTRGWEKEVVVSPRAAFPHMAQQIAILEAAKRRFESSLFDIRQLLQAELFDSEIDSARELLKNGFLRAAGAVAGVVLERHLAEVCDSHKVAIRKKNPGIADFNDALKAAGVIEVPQWRNIQLLGDIRNLCDHNKTKEPSKEQVGELIDGCAKILKTVF